MSEVDRSRKLGRPAELVRRRRKANEVVVPEASSSSNISYYEAAFKRHAKELIAWAEIRSAALTPKNLEELADAKANLEQAMLSIEKLVQAIEGDLAREELCLAWWQVISAATTIGSRAVYTESQSNALKMETTKRLSDGKKARRQEGTSKDALIDTLIRRYHTFKPKVAIVEVNSDLTKLGMREIKRSTFYQRVAMLKKVNTSS